jgi:hypothetical protein
MRDSPHKRYPARLRERKLVRWALADAAVAFASQSVTIERLKRDSLWNPLRKDPRFDVPGPAVAGATTCSVVPLLSRTSSLDSQEARKHHLSLLGREDPPQRPNSKCTGTALLQHIGSCNEHSAYP